MSNLKIDQEEFNHKAQHILDTVVKPQVERYENANRLNKLEQLASLLQSAWTNGDWKAETPNEREMEKIMVELGYWEDKNNDGGNPGIMTTMSPTDLDNENIYNDFNTSLG